MRQYLIRFWWGTDCRCEARVKAMNEVSALHKAYEECNLLESWVTGRYFKITIELDQTV